MGRLVKDDRKATVTQITPCYNQGMQNTISECTTRRTLKQMGYSSRTPHRVPLQSAKNRKRRLQFAQVHQNWTIEDWKTVAWSDESRFLLRHSDGRVRIWHKEHESMDPFCLVSTVQAGGGGAVVWGIFSWHTLCPLVPIDHCFNATAYLSIVADHVHPFMTTVYPSSDGYFQQDNAPCHQAQIISDWFLEHDNEFTLLKRPPQSPDLNPIEHLWDVVEREIHMCSRQICSNCVMLSCQYGPKYLRNVSNTLFNLCPEKLREFGRQKGVQPDTSMVYLINWPVSVYVNEGIQMQPPFKSASVDILIAKNVLMNILHLQFDLCCHISPRFTDSEIKCPAG